jgi:hypothetical protein
MKLPLFSQLRSSAQKLFNRSTRQAVEQAMDTLRQHQSSLPVIDLSSLLQPAPVARVPRDARFIEGSYSNHAAAASTSCMCRPATTASPCRCW